MSTSPDCGFALGLAFEAPAGVEEAGVCSGTGDGGSPPTSAQTEATREETHEATAHSGAGEQTHPSETQGKGKSSESACAGA